MIHLGLDDAAKSAVVTRYVEEHAVRKVYVLSPAKFAPSYAAEKMADPTTQGDGRPGLYIEWADIIQYRFFYKLMQEVDRDTLIVVNECLRTQNRHDLTYNCIRNFVQQTPHQLVFQYLPIIDTIEDFMVLFDFDTRSRRKREPFTPAFLDESRPRGARVELDLREVSVSTDAKTKAAYAREKRALIDGLGLKDPHTIPRNLYLRSGKAKLAHVAPGASYVGRNNRFKLEHMQTYKEAAYPRAPYVVFELPHNFIDFADFLTLSRQTAADVLVADLKVDRWYFERYQAWAGRVRDVAATLHG